MNEPKVSIREPRFLRRAPLQAAVLLERWRQLPHIDRVRLREDLDAALDPSL